MYVTATVSHAPLPDAFLVTTAYGSVNAHLPNVYLSLTPDEARRLAQALVVGALQVDAEKSAQDIEE